MEPVFFRSAARMRAWLEEHHAVKRELLAGFYRKGPRAGITYPEALGEALCFGWIDGVRKRIDAETYSIRFTPRNPGSLWSTVNTRRAEELVSRGRMKLAGMQAFEARGARDQRPNAAPALGPALEAALRGNHKASAFFDAQPAGYRKVVISWVMSAKKEETRTRRLSHVIGHSERGTRLDPLRPNR